jgi:hypothetical protein
MDILYVLVSDDRWRRVIRSAVSRTLRGQSLQIHSAAWRREARETAERITRCHRFTIYPILTIPNAIADPRRQNMLSQRDFPFSES